MNQFTRSITAIAIAAGLLAGPRTAIASSQTFANVYYLVSSGEKAKPRQIRSRIVLAGESLQVQGHRGEVLRELRYAEIRHATYSKSKHPRWKSGAITAAFVGVFALPVFFMKTKRHWLTVQTESEYVALRLSKKNYPLILAAFETSAGLRVDRIVE